MKNYLRCIVGILTLALPVIGFATSGTIQFQIYNTSGYTIEKGSSAAHYISEAGSPKTLTVSQNIPNNSASNSQTATIQDWGDWWALTLTFTISNTTKTYSTAGKKKCNITQEDIDSNLPVLIEIGTLNPDTTKVPVTIKPPVSSSCSTDIGKNW